MKNKKTLISSRNMVCISLCCYIDDAKEIKKKKKFTHLSQSVSSLQVGAWGGGRKAKNMATKGNGRTVPAKASTIQVHKPFTQ